MADMQKESGDTAQSSFKKEDENSYRNILKGTSLMGGVQIFQVLISLIRGKFVALLLGPEGMGINSIFTSSSNTISQLSSLGLNTALIKEAATLKGNNIALANLKRLAMRILNISGGIAALLCVLLAPQLSNLSFGSSAFAWQFMLLGLAIYLYTVGYGKLAIVQGLHKLKLVSKASIFGGLAGLLLGVPLYYLWGTHGIVPAIVMVAATYLIYYSFALKKALPTPTSLQTSDVEISSQPVQSLSAAPLIKLGLLLISPALIAAASQYGLNIFIRFAGSLDDVGLFNAANSITNQYSSLVFSAMAVDYFPRLSSAKNDNPLLVSIVNRQTEVVALVIAPVVIAVLLAAPVVIRILLSSQFISIAPLVRLMAFGILLKALSFPLGYIAFAKDNKKLFFWLESILGNFLYLLLSFPSFYFLGIMGLGYALIVENIIIIVIYYIVNARYYHYRFSVSAARKGGIAVVISAVALLATYIPDNLLAYGTISIILTVSVLYSISHLKRLLQN